MRWLAALTVLLGMVSSHAYAAPGDDILRTLCLRGFEKTTMPAGEAQRFCDCVGSDVSPRLTERQRQLLLAMQSDLAQGRATKPEVVANSSVRDLVIAGQARCEAAFYPPSAPILVRAGDLELTLRCDADSHRPEAFIYLRSGALLSKAELAALDKKMMAGQDVSEVANVAQRVDGVARKRERWEIDITGQIVASPEPAALVDALRTARSYEVVIERGSNLRRASFDLTGKIDPRWAPCGGIGR